MNFQTALTKLKYCFFICKTGKLWYTKLAFVSSVSTRHDDVTAYLTPKSSTRLQLIKRPKKQLSKDSGFPGRYSKQALI
jgi:hypothetical protein